MSYFPDSGDTLTVYKGQLAVHCLREICRFAEAVHRLSGALCSMGVANFMGAERWYVVARVSGGVWRKL